MIFNSLKSLTIPEGEVKSISVNGMVLWSKSTGDYRDLYQRVKSITRPKSGGWFRTDFVANNESGLELTFSVPSFSDTATMGSRESSVTNGRCYIFYPRAATVGYIGWNSAQSWSVSTEANTVYTTRLNWLNSRKAAILNADGSTKATKSISGALVQQTKPIDICTYNNGNGRAMTFYGARLSQGDKIVREYIPCYCKSDGKIGAFETFTQTFIPNQEASGFTYSEEIGW